MAPEATAAKSLSFVETVNIVNEVSPLVILSDGGDAQVAVSPAMQARILTSTATGREGRSFGWVNFDLITSGKRLEHFNPYGGEDRIWLGPEGGQYAVFFAPGTRFELDDWYVPAPLDVESFDVVEQSESSIRMRKQFRLQNFSGFEFDVDLDRTVRMVALDNSAAGLTSEMVKGLFAVAFESHNVLTNRGNAAWTHESGLLSIWNIGQFDASPSTTVVIPFHPGPESELGVAINTDYFAVIPEDRLRLYESAGCFKGDSHYRSKLGVNPKRATGILGSYDPIHQVLTIVQHSLGAPGAEYVNSEWKHQEHPYAGDVANAYNDGPPPTGGPQLGAFYELESSSPAAALKPGESIEHVHRTIHLQGDKAKLDAAARAVLGLSLEQIENALPK
ncbi:MAG: DUF6786 family protein [Acidobacteriaceae bacterium]